MVALKYTSSIRDLSKFDLWLGIVLNTARVSINPWDMELIGALAFPTSNNFELKVISSSKEPRFQTKSVVWSLQELFNQYNRNEDYASANFITTLDGAPLGLGSIKSTLISSESGQMNTSSSSALTFARNNDTSVAEYDTKALANNTSASAQVAQLGRKGFELRLEYNPNGALFTDQGFINTVIRFLVLAANKDPKTLLTAKVAVANLDEGYFIEISSMGGDDDLSVENIIRALGSLPREMYEQRTGGRWAELKGLIRFDGVNLGRIKIAKGSINSGTNATCVDNWLAVG